MITSDKLENREADPKGSDKVQADLRRVKGRGPETDDGLAVRLQTARDLVPARDHELHCGHCWGQGRDAAIRVIEGATEK